MTLPIDLSGKTILVCGTHKGGIGGAACRQIAKAGATVIALDNQASYAEDTAAEVRAFGGTIHTFTADLLDPEARAKVIPAVLEKFGPIDGLANIVGGTRAEDWTPIDETPEESFRFIMNLNFDYVFFLCRDVAKEWIRTGRTGAIVNIGSVSAKDSAPWHGPYGAAKAAVITLTRTMANEWHEFGIRANSVSPGAVPSERTMEKAKKIPGAPMTSANAVEIILTQPEELANAITFLLSDLASGISGQNLTLDRSLSTKFCAGQKRTRK